MTTDVTIDTSILAKGLIPPRRRIKDQLYEDSLRLHSKSKEILLKIENGEYINHIPLIALIETACVVSRLTNDSESVNLSLSFVNQNSRMYSDAYLLERSIEIGKITKASGLDVIFMACADITGSALMTDDRKMFERACEYGLDAKFLRDK